MLLKGMNDPLLKAYQHPKSRVMISRFRELAGDRKLSDWQIFCVLVTGFINYWYVQAGNFTINVSYSKTRQFDFLQDFLHFSVTLDEVICDKQFRCPDFVLPRYDVPYEITKTIQEGLLKHLNFYRDLFHYNLSDAGRRTTAGTG